MTNVAVNSSRARCWHSLNTRLHPHSGAPRQILMGHDRQAGKWVSSELQELWSGGCAQPLHSPSVTALTPWPPAREDPPAGTLGNSGHSCMDVESAISTLGAQNIKSGWEKEQFGLWHEFLGLHSEGLSKTINVCKVPWKTQMQDTKWCARLALTGSCRMLKSLCKQLGILASPGLLLKAAGCRQGYRVGRRQCPHAQGKDSVH